MKHRVLFVPVAAVLAIPGAASAHFILDQPLSFQKQDSLGSPQKKGPCGDAGTKTGDVTKLTAGQMVHFEFTETIPHGGHYRIALGLKGQADLPLDPTVKQQSGFSISVPIQDPPVFPVLADGVNPHKITDIEARKKWTADVKLPAGMTCDACVLQITQFMTDHDSNTGGNDGFFYHHCADVQIMAASTPDAAAPDAAATVDAAVTVDAAPPADSAAATGGATGGNTGGATGGSTGGATGGNTGGATGGSTGGGTGGAPTGGAGGTGGGDTGGAPAKKDSGGCAVGGGSAGSLLALLLLAAYFTYRARR